MQLFLNCELLSAVQFCAVKPGPDSTVTAILPVCPGNCWGWLPPIDSPMLLMVYPWLPHVILATRCDFCGCLSGTSRKVIITHQGPQDTLASSMELLISVDEISGCAFIRSYWSWTLRDSPLISSIFIFGKNSAALLSTSLFHICSRISLPVSWKLILSQIWPLQNPTTTTTSFIYPM